MRFHSLPESKRHPGDESEYALVLDRYHTVLDALFAAGDVHVITPAWSTEARTLPFRQEDGHWRSLLAEDDPDPDFRTHCHLFAARHRRRHGCLDEVSGVLITDTGMRRVLHPYDGGADVLLTTPGERDRMGDRYADWLSRLRSGLRHAGHSGPLATLRPCPCHPRPCRAPCLPLGLDPGGRAGRRGAG
ncbi:DUF3885 domain-containing protein [Streptomyces albidoflavus]|uniref:DUF3885 domain-containing protein n=1 Tax=Streptomyces albidoflavus TaxID=1886 RepID=UPI003D9EEE4D